MKKIVLILLALVLSVALISCVDNTSAGEESKTRPVVPTKESEPAESEPEESGSAPSESADESNQGSEPAASESASETEPAPETEPASETKKNGTIELPRDEF